MKVGESHRMAAERFMKHAPTGGFVDDVMSRRDAAVKAILRSWGHMSKETLLSVVTAYMDVADLERVADRARRDD